VQFTLGSQTITVTSAPYQATFSLASLPDGQQIITANATGFANETASATIAINVKQTPPPAPNAGLINAEPPSNGFSLVHGSATSVEAGDQVQITDTNSNRLVTTNAAADGSFSTNIAAVAGDVLSIVTVDVVGNQSPATSITVRHIASLPPVSSVQPADGSTAIPTNSVVVVRFASVVQPASVVSGTVTLSQGSTAVTGTLGLSSDQLSVTFIPSYRCPLPKFLYYSSGERYYSANRAACQPGQRFWRSAPERALRGPVQQGDEPGHIQYQ
jgi:hypothetical protein